MSGALMNKVWDLFGVDPSADTDDENEYEIDEYETENDEVEEKRIFGKRNNNKVVNMPQMQQIKMVISQPTSFEQSEGICDLLKEKKFNFENENAGAFTNHFSLSHIQKVSNSIFLIAPYNYDITNEMAREEIKSKLSVSWLKNNNIND